LKSRSSSRTRHWRLDYVTRALLKLVCSSSASPSSLAPHHSRTRMSEMQRSSQVSPDSRSCTIAHCIPSPARTPLQPDALLPPATAPCVTLRRLASTPFRLRRTDCTNARPSRATRRSSQPCFLWFRVRQPLPLLLLVPRASNIATAADDSAPTSHGRRMVA
jgi:hypothetical protein